jgi:hypothetical protein
VKALGITRFLVMLSFGSPSVYARGGGHGGHALGHHTSRYCETCPRDAHGRIQRDPKAKQEFMGQTGHPHGRPGYVVDHIVPLEKGGYDYLANMQWQAIEEAKQKNKWE